MKILNRELHEFISTGRWDIDFHLPPEGIKKYPSDLLKRIDQVADIVKAKRDPAKKPEDTFFYIDIASINVLTGEIVNPQELLGNEAPSRARKVISAFDIIISTCRPTRGAISVVPMYLHNQIASTAFSVIRAKENINPFYLCYAIRLPSTIEQFRKWSTGSSYPAILDEDVEKSLIPVPDKDEQDRIAFEMLTELEKYNDILSNANKQLKNTIFSINSSISSNTKREIHIVHGKCITINEIEEKYSQLPKIDTDNITFESELGGLL
jgi:type I restriction enzyme S subunit